MKIIFSGGGTAGHVNPALAAAGYLKKKEPDCQVMFAGGAGGIEEKLVGRAGYQLFTFRVSGLSRKLSPAGIKHNIKALRDSSAAKRLAKEILTRERPDLVVGTGGYASYPMVAAAQKCGIKTAVLEVNATPGVALKRLAGKADCVMVSYAETQQLMQGAKRVVVTGSPVREEILRCREQSYPPYFDNNKPMVVSFWGSVGALYMNKKMEGFIRLAAETKAFNHIHAAGASNYQWMPGELEAMGVDLKRADNIDLREYIFDMDRALGLADLVICRAGGTLAELCAAGKPSIIVPSPYVANNHQEKNARLLERAGAAVVITEAESTPELLFETAQKMLGDPGRLRQMGEAATKLAKPDALERIYQAIRQTVES